MFTYSQARFEYDMQYLGELFAQIETMTAEVWPLTPDARKCRYCEFRSLCDRGREAGAAYEIEDGKHRSRSQQTTKMSMCCEALLMEMHCP